MSNQSTGDQYECGDVVIADFPHLNMLKRCQELDPRYGELFDTNKPDGHFVLITEGKSRPMLVLTRKEDWGRRGKVGYALFKMTSTKSQTAFSLGLDENGRGEKRERFIDLAEVWTLPGHLVKSRKSTGIPRLDPLHMKLLAKKKNQMDGMLPPSASELRPDRLEAFLEWEVEKIEGRTQTTLYAARVDCTDSRTPTKTWHAVERFSDTPSVEQRQQALAKVLNDKTFFLICGLCMRTCNIGEMHDEHICRSCSSQQQGISQ